MTTITVTIWHNVAVDGQAHHTGSLDGYQLGDLMVRVFTYQADPAGRLAEDIAEEAFAICNGHPPRRSRRRPGGAVLPAQVAVAVVPRKLGVLQQVMLPSPSRRVAQVVVKAAGRADVL